MYYAYVSRDIHDVTRSLTKSSEMDEDKIGKMNYIFIYNTSKNRFLKLFFY